MTRVFDLLIDLMERLTAAVGAAQAEERDRYISAALNPREASQRIHRLECAGACLQP